MEKLETAEIIKLDSIDSKDTNFNINRFNKSYSQCIKTINDFGSTTYQDICTGEQATVRWGTNDYIANVGFWSVVVGCISFLILVAIVGMFAKD